MVESEPIRLSEAIVDPRDMVREYVVILAVAAVTAFVAVDAPNAFSLAVAGVAAVFAVVAVLAATPGSVRVTIDGAGLRLRVFFVLARRIPWSAIGAIEVAEGWSGETVAVEVHGPAGEGVILGLPVDPVLGQRAFVSTFGRTPEAFRALLESKRPVGAG